MTLFLVLFVSKLLLQIAYSKTRLGVLFLCYKRVLTSIRFEYKFKIDRRISHLNNDDVIFR